MSCKFIDHGIGKGLGLTHDMLPFRKIKEKEVCGVCDAVSIG
jgi:hypothetical protein